MEGREGAVLVAIRTFLAAPRTSSTCSVLIPFARFFLFCAPKLCYSACPKVYRYDSAAHRIVLLNQRLGEVTRAMAAVGDLKQSLARLRESMGVQTSKEGGNQAQAQQKSGTSAQKDEQLAKRPNSQLSTNSGHPGRPTSTAAPREACHSSDTERQTAAISPSPDDSFRDEV